MYVAKKRESMWSSGPPRGVWGSSQPKLASSDWLIARMNKVGLDGSICAEYICSLIELYPKSKSDRDAAIADFLMDSVTSSSSLGTSSEQSRFVNETLFELQTRLGDSKTVLHRAPVATAPESSVASSIDSLAASAPKKGFKKGVKLSGSALKQVVGHVKPSFVQRYSDDENPSVAPPQVTVTRFVSAKSSDQPVQSGESSFPSLETPQRSTTNSSITKRNKNKAREIGPDEDWSDTHPEEQAPTPWKTPMTSHPSPPGESHPRNVTASKLVLTSSVVIHAEPEVEAPLAIDIPEPSEEQKAPLSPPEAQVSPTILLSPQSLLMNIPTDILSFDFRFEGDEEGSTPPRVEPEQKSPEPFDLLKQMFSQPGFTTALSTASCALAKEDLPIEKSQRKYSVAFLLSVLKEMKSSQGGDIPTPIELQGLTQTELSPVARPKTEVSGWRSNDRTSPNTPESQSGSWRASGYAQRANHKRAQAPVTVAEEGFW